MTGDAILNFSEATFISRALVSVSSVLFGVLLLYVNIDFTRQQTKPHIHIFNRLPLLLLLL